MAPKLRQLIDLGAPALSADPGPSSPAGPVPRRARLPAQPCPPAGPGKGTGRGDFPSEALSFWVQGGWSLQPRGVLLWGAGVLVPVSIVPHTHTQLARTASVLLFAIELALGAGSSQWPPSQESPKGVGDEEGRKALGPDPWDRLQAPSSSHLAPPPPSSGAGKWLPGPPVGTAPQAGRGWMVQLGGAVVRGTPGRGGLWNLASHWAVDSAPVSCHTRWLSA